MMKTTKLFLLKIYWIITKFALVKFYGYDVFLSKRDSIVHNKLMLMMLGRKNLKLALKRAKEQGASYKYYMDFKWNNTTEALFRVKAFAYLKVMYRLNDEYVNRKLSWFTGNYGLTNPEVFK